MRISLERPLRIVFDRFAEVLHLCRCRCWLLLLLLLLLAAAAAAAAAAACGCCCSSAGIEVPDVGPPVAHLQKLVCEYLRRLGLSHKWLRILMITDDES
jgi:hypothetical protein